MRRIFLMRHGMPLFPTEDRVCLGRTDLPLSPLGRMQACLLGEALAPVQASFVFSSPLLRSLETAMAFPLPLRVIDDFVEQNMGVWDGLSFEEIRRRWPDLYHKRGKDPLLIPPEAEALHDVQQRVSEALKLCLTRFPGDILITAHASVIQCILATITGISLSESRQYRLPYGGYAVLEDAENTLSLCQASSLPQVQMTPALAEKLLSAADPGDQAKVHCRAVAKKAAEVADALPIPVQRETLICAALLHDVARREPHHAQTGAQWMNTLGYDHLAALISQHHDPADNASLEALILYISDKCVLEDRVVPLEERFAQSAGRCRDDAARAAHTCRLKTAREVRTRINTLCGMEIIP